MRILLLTAFCITAFLVSGCAPGITRTGYSLPPNQVVEHPTRQRPIAIQCNVKYNTNDVVILGRIHEYDNGFSSDCGEAQVLDIFCREGDMLSADLINLTEENPPDLWSTCYRAKAEFLRYKDRQKAEGLVSDAKFAPNLIIERSKKFDQRINDEIIGTLLAGPLGGIIVWSATQPDGGTNHLSASKAQFRPGR